jgi:hypothetical protein
MNIANYFERVSKQLSNVHSLSDRFEIMEEIRSGLGREAQESARDDSIYQEWVNLQIDETLSSEAVTMASEKDGSALANLCERIPPQDIFVK